MQIWNGWMAKSANDIGYNLNVRQFREKFIIWKST